MSQRFKAGTLSSSGFFCYSTARSTSARSRRCTRSSRSSLATGSTSTSSSKCLRTSPRPILAARWRRLRLRLSSALDRTRAPRASVRFRLRPWRSLRCRSLSGLRA
eukprot:Amastigsp_a209_142.p4 type:complete len:106 gc:universal Amastigsp_a209_142:341-658(+)